MTRERAAGGGGGEVTSTERERGAMSQKDLKALARLLHRYHLDLILRNELSAANIVNTVARFVDEDITE